MLKSIFEPKKQGLLYKRDKLSALSRLNLDNFIKPVGTTF